MEIESHTPFNAALQQNLIYLVAYFLNRSILSPSGDRNEGGSTTGINVHMWNDYAIKIASEHGYTAVVKLLLDHGADIHVDEDIPLKQTIHEHRIDTAQLLLERKADVHVKGDMPIVLASQYDDIDMIELLLAYGANIHTHHNEILKWAESNPQRKLARFLREKGLI